MRHDHRLAVSSECLWKKKRERLPALGHEGVINLDSRPSQCGTGGTWLHLWMMLSFIYRQLYHVTVNSLLCKWTVFYSLFLSEAKQ